MGASTDETTLNKNQSSFLHHTINIENFKLVSRLLYSSITRGQKNLIVFNVHTGLEKRGGGLLEGHVSGRLTDSKEKNYNNYILKNIYILFGEGA